MLNVVIAGALDVMPFFGRYICIMYYICRYICSTAVPTMYVRTLCQSSYHIRIRISSSLPPITRIARINKLLLKYRNTRLFWYKWFTCDIWFIDKSLNNIYEKVVGIPKTREELITMHLFKPPNLGVYAHYLKRKTPKYVPMKKSHLLGMILVVYSDRSQINLPKKS